MEHADVALPAVPVFQDLYLCTAGRSVCCPGHSFGPDVRLNYLIHYILSGKGIFETDQVRYRLGQGQGFLIEPGQTTRYQADEKEPWTYIWVGFNGTLAPALLEALGLGRKSPIFSSAAARELTQITDRLLFLATSGIQLSLNQQSCLLTFFRVLASRDSLAPEISVPDTKANYHMEKALAYIRDNYALPIRVSDVADYLGISRFHLRSLFMDMVKQTPQQYMAGFRLGRAREFLTTTDYPVRQIAQLCGYSNPDVFSKAFKRKYLASPSWYRQYALDHPGENPSESLRLAHPQGDAHEGD